MSTDTPDTGDSPPGRQTVADPEEFNQQRRLSSIHSARDRAREIRELTQDPTATANSQELAAIYRTAVQNYIGELEGLLEQYEFSEDEPDYWRAYPLGPVVINPPPELREARQNPRITVIGDASLKSRRRTISGLHGFLTADCPYRETFTLPVKQRHEGQQTLTTTVVSEMPVKVSYEAFRAANQFFTLTGFDVELETSEHRAVVDEKLIKEVEEWRRRNIQ